MTRKDPSYHPFSYIYFSDGQWHTKSFDETGQRVNNTGYSDVSFGTKDPFFFQVKLEEGFLSVSLRPEEKVQFYSIETIQLRLVLRKTSGQSLLCLQNLKIPTTHILTSSPPDLPQPRVGERAQFLLRFDQHHASVSRW